MLPWVNDKNGTCRLFLHHPIQKLGRFLVIFAVRHINFVWVNFVLAPTASYIIHLLKVHCNSVYLSELYK